MESEINIDKQCAKKLATYNAMVAGIMLLTCLGNELAILSFPVGVIASIVNLILMIGYISKNQTYSYLTCIICMLLMPIIGFGCCASGFSGLQI
jgi:hypothetical protein